MEHIIQFGIGIDDEAIKKRVEESAEKEIVKNIEQSVRNRLFDGGYYKNARVDDPLSEYSKRIIDDFLEKHKDVIIEKAAKYLAEKMIRTKAVREATETVIKKGD